MFACHSCERPWGHLKFGASSLMQELSPHSCFSPKPQQDPVHGWRARRDAIQEMLSVPDVLVLVTFLFGDPSGMRRMRVKLPFLPLPWFPSKNRG